ncbi:MAG: galactose mutarotase [Spirochaetales bacterium]|nr:galactose mutarotase [Spirochaetales bacterium]
MTLNRSEFGIFKDQKIFRYDFATEKGFSYSLINYGATLTDVRMADREGRILPVITGYDTVEEYAQNGGCFGATIGRVGNRIAGAAFTIEGTTYKLEANNGPNNLHGGPVNFNRQVWEGESFEKDGKAGVRFSYTSPDGESGFPGNLKTSVTYTFSEEGEIQIDYKSESDKTTPVNLTNHTYWNMAGLTGSETIKDQELQLKAASYTPVDEFQIPTGIAPVEGTPFDFRAFTPLGRQDAPETLYDHNWVLDGEGMREAAILIDRPSGRKLTVLTDQPGIQVYTAGGMGDAAERNGRTYPFMGAALETQNFPNCVNDPDFPDCLLRPGEVYESTTIFRLELESGERRAESGELKEERG